MCVAAYGLSAQNRRAERRCDLLRRADAGLAGAEPERCRAGSQHVPCALGSRGIGCMGAAGSVECTNSLRTLQPSTAVQYSTLETLSRVERVSKANERTN